MARKKPHQPSLPTVTHPFRLAERLFKQNAPSTTLPLVFDPSLIVWEAPAEDGRVRGTWTSGDGTVEECWKVRLGELAERSGMGQGRWKGKGREEEGDWAVVVPRIPGLVLFPSVLPPSLQRSLVVETLQNARRPNLTNLDPHYELPDGGLWSAWVEGRGDEVVPSIAGRGEEAVASSGCSTPTGEGGARQGVEEQTRVEGEKIASSRQGSRDGREKEVTVRELLPKLRWSNVGFHYNWTTKLYEFERGLVPLPPLIHRCCRDIIRSTPWNEVFRDVASETSQADWTGWNETYEPDAGIVNFYQLKDSLTAHVDQAEADAVRPLVSFSLGHSSIFLVGGTTRDVPPLAVLLRSGDGLCMSGSSRLAYHGLPRVLPGTLPDYLSSTQTETVEGTRDWRVYGEYLERGARINVNVRSVF